MRRPILKSLCKAAWIFALPARVLAVWPPSTAFQEEHTPVVYGLIVIVFVVGIVLGIWVQKNLNEHK